MITSARRNITVTRANECRQDLVYSNIRILARFRCLPVFLTRENLEAHTVADITGTNRKNRVIGKLTTSNGYLSSDALFRASRRDILHCRRV